MEARQVVIIGAGPSGSIAAALLIRRMISSVPAGYAWDERNPFVSDPQRRLNSIVAWVG